MPTVATREELAGALGLSGARVSTFLDAGMPGAAADRFDVTACAEWAIQYAIVHGHPDGDVAAASEIEGLRNLVYGDRMLSMAESDWIERLVPHGVVVSAEWAAELNARVERKLREAPAKYPHLLLGCSNETEARQHLADAFLAIMRDLEQIRPEMDADGWTYAGPPTT